MSGNMTYAIYFIPEGSSDAMFPSNKMKRGNGGVMVVTHEIVE